MLAALLTDYGAPLSLERVPDPEPSPEGVVLRVDACGVCRSDWHVWQGDWAWRMPLVLPHVMGHELAGTVVATGARAPAALLGRRVTVPFHLMCASCGECAQGHSNLCRNYSAIGFQRPGAFAELVAIPDAERNLVALPGALPAGEAAALGCRFMSAWHAVRDVAAVAPGETVAVIGAGGVGRCCVQVAVASGARVVAVDPGEAQRAGALVEGAEGALPPDEHAAAALREWSGGGCDVAIDAHGGGAALACGIAALRPRGRYVRLGLTGQREQGQLTVPMDAVTKGELRVAGAVGCPPASFRRMMAAIADGTLSPGRLVEGRGALGDVNEALRRMTGYDATGIFVIEPGAVSIGGRARREPA